MARELLPLVLFVAGVALSPLPGPVVRSGVKISALPLPVPPYRDGIVKVVAKIKKNLMTNGTEEIESQNVTVRAPAVSVNYWNTSQYPAKIEIEPTGLQNLLASPIFSELLDDIVVSALEAQQSTNDDIFDSTLATSVDKLKRFAEGSSSADILQKAFNTTFLKSLLDQIENKSKLLYDIENSIEPSEPSNKITKREAIWSEAWDTAASTLPRGNQLPKSEPKLMLAHRPTRAHGGKIIRELPKYWEFVYGSRRQRRSAAEELGGLDLLRSAYLRHRHHLFKPSPQRMVASRPLHVRPLRRQRRILHKPLIQRLVTLLINPQNTRLLLNAINATLRPLIPVLPPIPSRPHLRNMTPIWSNIVPPVPYDSAHPAAAVNESPIEALFGNIRYPQTTDSNLPYRNYWPSIESISRPVSSAAIPFTGVSFGDANVDQTLKNFHNEAQWREYWRSKTDPLVGAFSNVLQNFLIT